MMFVVADLVKRTAKIFRAFRFNFTLMHRLDHKLTRNG